ncbi:MAG: YkgJ family cysteine cluster protein [Planctomycetes bacterium]|nr:YkgJ family cysteine cluster protein [Planctomycetota bacterium]
MSTHKHPKSSRPALADSAPPWFAEGVRFTCQPGCRRCCGGAPGDVWVTEAEIAAIAEYMKLAPDEFERSYLRRYASGRASIRERSNGDCVLLDEKGCSVYPARPKQCRDYPFWPEVMATPFAWIAEMNRCPGIGDGELHEAPKIVDLLKTQTED